MYEDYDDFQEVQLMSLRYVGWSKTFIRVIDDS